MSLQRRVCPCFVGQGGLPSCCTAGALLSSDNAHGNECSTAVIVDWQLIVATAVDEDDGVSVAVLMVTVVAGV